MLSQVQCDALDEAKLAVLQSIQHAAQTEVRASELRVGTTYYVYKNRQYEPFTLEAPYSETDPATSGLKFQKITTCPPQSMLVVGGGPTGLVMTLHCLENVLRSEGKMRLHP